MLQTDVKNIVLITIDALRADYVSTYAEQSGLTPNLDSFATSNAQFQQAHSVSSHTREAVPAMLTGRYPTEAISEDYILAAETITSKLSAEGFSTAAFHSNPYVSRAYGYGNGFDRFSDDLYLGKYRFLALAQRAFDKLRGRNYARGEDIARQSLNWFSSVDGPRFLWCHYMDTHGPYEPPNRYLDDTTDKSISESKQSLYNRAVDDPDSITDAERQYLLSLYEGEVRYIDDIIGDFLSELQAMNSLQNTLIIISADHGEAFGEHGYFSHPRELHNELVDIPLLISAPESRFIDVPASTLDIVPTILDAVDIEAGDLPGISLFELSDDVDDHSDRIVFSQARTNSDSRRFSARTQTEICYLERELSTGEVLSTPEDGCSPRTQQELRTHSEQHLTNYSGTEADFSAENSGEIERRLEALGYRE